MEYRNKNRIGICVLVAIVAFAVALSILSGPSQSVPLALRAADANRHP